MNLNNLAEQRIHALEQKSRSIKATSLERVKQFFEEIGMKPHGIDPYEHAVSYSFRPRRLGMFVNAYLGDDYADVVIYKKTINGDWTTHDIRVFTYDLSREQLECELASVSNTIQLAINTCEWINPSH